MDESKAGATTEHREHPLHTSMGSPSCRVPSAWAYGGKVDERHTRLRPPRTPTSNNVPNHAPSLPASCMVDIRVPKPRLSGLSVLSSSQGWIWKTSRAQSWSWARTTSCTRWPSRLVQPAKLLEAALASAQGFRPWPKSVTDDGLSVNSNKTRQAIIVESPLYQAVWL